MDSAVVKRHCTNCWFGYVKFSEDFWGERTQEHYEPQRTRSLL
jgi:hypothetical protein